MLFEIVLSSYERASASHALYGLRVTPLGHSSCQNKNKTRTLILDYPFRLTHNSFRPQDGTANCGKIIWKPHNMACIKLRF